MAFELDLKFTERLCLSDVSRQSVVRASTIYSKASLVLSSFCKTRAQQITASGIVALNLVRMPETSGLSRLFCL